MEKLGSNLSQEEKMKISSIESKNVEIEQRKHKTVMKTSPTSNTNYNIFFDNNGMFGPDDVAKLDSVLANVNTILESLDGSSIPHDSLADVSRKEDNVVTRNGKSNFTDSLDNNEKRTRSQTFPSVNSTDKIRSNIKTRSHGHTGRHGISTASDSNRSCPIRDDVIFSYNCNRINGKPGELEANCTSLDDNIDKVVSVSYVNKPAVDGLLKSCNTVDNTVTNAIKEDSPVFTPHVEHKFPSSEIDITASEPTVILRRKQSEYDNVIKPTRSFNNLIEQDNCFTPDEQVLFRSSTILGESDKKIIFPKKKVGKSKSSDYADIISIKSLDNSENTRPSEVDISKKTKSRIAHLLPKRSSSLKQAFSKKLPSSPKPRVKNREILKSKQKSRYSVNLEDIHYFNELSFVQSTPTHSKTKLSSSSSFESKKSPLRKKGKLRYHNLKLNIPGSYRRALSLDESSGCGSAPVTSGFHTATGVENQPTFPRQTPTKKSRNIYHKFLDSFRSSQADLSSGNESDSKNISAYKPGNYVIESGMTPQSQMKTSKSEPTLNDCNVYPNKNNHKKNESKPDLDQNENSFYANPYYDDGSGVARRQTIDSSYVRHRRKPTTSSSQPTAEKHGVELWKRFTKKHNPDDRIYSSLPRSKQSKNNKKINRLSWQNDKSFKISTSFQRQNEMNISSKGASNKKAWKQQSKQESGEKIWWAMGHGIWSNMGGRSVELEEVNLLQLSESECDALQEIAMRQLNKIDLGVALSCPKDEFKTMNQKESFMKKYGLPSHHKNKSKAGTTHVFGIPLVRVVENDQLLRLQTADENLDGVCNSNESSPHNSRHDSRCSSPEEFIADKQDDGLGSPSMSPKLCSKMNRHSANVGKLGKPLQRRRAIAASSLDEIDPTQTKLLEALVSSGSRDKKLSLIPHTMLQVPYVVQKCSDHILKHGVNIVGIFRVAGSKKRVNQLQKDFDRGVDVELHDDYNPHDVAALLKEFIRDLPEALLTRQLYQAFISVTRLPRSLRLSALQCLVWLLPIPNRDTLYSLLSFLHNVAENAEDKVNDNGETIPGNKMNAVNLATIFGPNILHKNKKSKDSSDHQYQVQSADRAEESTHVINVVQDMILNYQQLFLVPCDIHDDMLRTLKERDPDAVDFLLRRKAGNHMRDKCGDFKLENNTDEITCDLRNNDNFDVTASNESDGDMSSCQSQSKNNNKSPSDDNKPLILPRNSYEQATGHLVTSYSGNNRRMARRKSDGKHKPESLSINQTQQQDASGVADISPSLSSASLAYSPLFLEGRSVSFSDEDLREIFQSEAIRKSHLRKLSQVNEEEPHSYSDCSMIDEYIDPFDFNIELSQHENMEQNTTGNKRRGGFSVKPSADSGLGSAASLTSTSPTTDNRSNTVCSNLPKDSNNNTEFVSTDPKLNESTATIEHCFEAESTPPSQIRKRQPSGLNLNIHGKYFNNKFQETRGVARVVPLRHARRLSKDDMFISNMKIHHGAKFENKDEVPDKDEIAKWKSWSNNKQNVKPIRFHSQTLV